MDGPCGRYVKKSLSTWNINASESHHSYLWLTVRASRETVSPAAADESVQPLTPLTPDAGCYSLGHRIQPQIFVMETWPCIKRPLEQSKTSCHPDTGQSQYKTRAQLIASLQASDWLHLPRGIRHPSTGRHQGFPWNGSTLALQHEIDEKAAGWRWVETPWPSIYIGEFLSYLTYAACRMGSNRRSLVNDQRRDLAYREVLTISATLASFPFA
jgi:hypothetical protein